MGSKTRKIVLASLLVLAGSLTAARAASDATPDAEVDVDADAPVTRSFQTTDGTKYTYLLVSPAQVEKDKAYPVLIALPPGNQKRAMADWMLRTYWTTEARRRGWIVVTPLRSGTDLVFERNRGHFVELVQHLSKALRIEGKKVHLAGVSNGGMSSFRAATAHPELVHSVMTLPGFPPSESDFGRLDRLKKIPVTMYVGAGDKDWVPQMERTRDDLVKAGGKVSLTIMPGEGHVIRSLGGGGTLFDVLDRTR